MLSNEHATTSPHGRSAREGGLPSAGGVHGGARRLVWHRLTNWRERARKSGLEGTVGDPPEGVAVLGIPAARARHLVVRVGHWTARRPANLAARVIVAPLGVPAFEPPSRIGAARRQRVGGALGNTVCRVLVAVRHVPAVAPRVAILVAR